VESLNSSNLGILNQGNEPNVCSRGVLDVIDNIPGPFGLL